MIGQGKRQDKSGFSKIQAVMGFRRPDHGSNAVTSLNISSVGVPYGMILTSLP